MPTERPAFCTAFSETDNGGKMGHGGQQTAWRKDFKTLITGLDHLNY